MAKFCEYLRQLLKNEDTKILKENISKVGKKIQKTCCSCLLKSKLVIKKSAQIFLANVIKYGKIAFKVWKILICKYSRFFSKRNWAKLIELESESQKNAEFLFPSPDCNLSIVHWFTPLGAFCQKYIFLSKHCFEESKAWLGLRSSSDQLFSDIPRLMMASYFWSNPRFTKR